MNIELQEFKDSLKRCFSFRMKKEYIDHLNDLAQKRSKLQTKRVIASALIIDALKDLFPDL
jgi:hypothetical protein